MIPSPSLARTLSGIFGCVSLSAWVFLLVPQLIENYKAKSGGALSWAFLMIWIAGDSLNLAGAIFTNLAPTAVAIGIFLIFADFVLVGQVLYYNNINSSDAGDAEDGEDAPLLGSVSKAVARGGEDDQDDGHGKGGGAELTCWQNGLSVLAVCVIGIVGWLASCAMGFWENDDSAPVELPNDGPVQGPLYQLGMFLGYVSALLYLFARFPQIYKNYCQKSCEGLSLLFFLLSLTGNLTYGLSLILYKPTVDELVKNVPWLLGSLGTMVQDVVVFVQFRIYGHRPDAPGLGAG